MNHGHAMVTVQFLIRQMEMQQGLMMSPLMSHISCVIPCDQNSHSFSLLTRVNYVFCNESLPNAQILAVLALKFNFI